MQHCQWILLLHDSTNKIYNILHILLCAYLVLAYIVC